MPNFDFKTTKERRMLQLNDLDELWLEAYKSSKMYKQRTKQWHDKDIMKKWFMKGDISLLFNSKLMLFSGKVRSHCALLRK